MGGAAKATTIKCAIAFVFTPKQKRVKGYIMKKLLIGSVRNRAVDSCARCFHRRPLTGALSCSEMLFNGRPKHIVTSTIPDWCPLPDWKDEYNTTKIVVGETEPHREEIIINIEAITYMTIKNHFDGTMNHYYICVGNEGQHEVVKETYYVVKDRLLKRHGLA